VERPPGYVVAVLAVLLAGGTLARCPRHPSPEVLARVRALPVELDPRRMDARELRQLPGVGTRLARAIVHARDGHRDSQALVWEDVPGIGEARAAAIRAWLAERGLATDPLAGEVTSYPVVMNRDPRATWTALVALLAACGERAHETAAPEVHGAAPVEVDRPATAATSPTKSAASNEVRARKLAVEGGEIAALSAGDDSAPLVLLLHGMRYSAETWRELGTLAALAEGGFHALAIDWPGFGETRAFSADPRPAQLLAQVIAAAGAERALLVGPSMGGGFALELVKTSPERVAGLVAIAPAASESFQLSSGSMPPALILWGEKDEVLPVTRARELADHMPGARVEILPAASHACYLDAPGRFHELLVSFTREVFARGQ